MCGVVGVLGEGTADVDQKLWAAIKALDHRGTREPQVNIRGSGGIGHVRLPIIGLSEEFDQPVCRDGWTVGFVGEILDYRKWDPDAESDVEVAVDSWINNRQRFRSFDGFWSIVALTPTGDLIAMVDYLAQKPLYVRDDKYARAVASEPDALVALGPVTPDEIYFSAVLKWGYCPETSRSPYREIRKMLPGEALLMYQDGGDLSLITDPLLPYTASAEVLKKEIEEAIYRRVLSADVPVASLVSGGLDSAIVHTVASRMGDLKVYHSENGERDRFNTLKIQDYTLLEEGGPPVTVDEALDYMQEPLDLGSLVPQIELSDSIQETVCLTGDGADEFFGGYGRALRYDSQFSDVFYELVGWHLPRLDRVMMRNCIEIRSPFLSRYVAGIALGLPRELRMNKRILRDLFRADLPPGVADTPKWPLRTPVVAKDREARSIQLVERFRERTWK